MAWDNTLVNRLRYYTGDIDGDDQVWTNTQLAKFITMGAIDVLSEVKLITTSFTIDSDTPAIFPDPVTDTSIDGGVGTLFVLRAAYIITLSEFRKNVAKYGFRIKDDNATFDGTAGLKSRAEVLTFYRENYERAVWEWEKGNKAACKAILGPYASADLSFGYNSDAQRRGATPFLY
jgi:hypothetical protein